MAVVALLGLAIRVGYILVIGPKIVFGADALWYRVQASTLADGIGFVNVGELVGTGRVVPTAAFPPLWPVVLSVVARLGGTSDWSFQLAGALAGTATIVLTAFVGRALAGRAVGLAAAAAVACSPSLIASDGSLMAESWFVALMTLAVLVALRAARSDSVWWWVALGGTLALATLTRSDALFLAPILVGATVLGAPSLTTTRRWVAVGTAMLVLVAGLTPWIVSRSTALDAPILVSSNSGTLLEGANCGRTYSGARTRALGLPVSHPSRSTGRRGEGGCRRPERGSRVRGRAPRAPAPRRRGAGPAALGALRPHRPGAR